MSNCNRSNDCFGAYRKCILALIVIAVIAIIGVNVYKSPMVDHTKYVESVATTGDIRDKLAIMASSERYRSGSNYLTQHQNAPTALNEGRDVIADASVSLAMDILRSLTPKQLAAIERDRKLSYTVLDGKQKALLSQFKQYSYVLGSQGPQEFSDSYITVMKQSTGHVEFWWYIFKQGKRVYSYSIGLEPNRL